MIRVRTITDDDIEAVAALTARVFGRDEAAKMLEELKAALLWCPFMRKEHCYVAEEEGRILAKWQVLDFVVRVAGVDIRTAGTQGVVAEPDQRGRGPTMQIVVEAIPKAIADGFDIALGFAQRGAFFKRIGTVQVMAQHTLRIDTRHIPKLRDDPFSPLTPLSELDVEPMFDHYLRSNADRSGSMVRTVKHWGWMPRRPPLVFICKDGYIGYRHWPNAVEIREIAGNSYEFYETALRKLGAIALEAGVGEVWGPVPIDHPFAQVCASHGAEVRVEYPRHSGCLAMLLNVDSFFSKLAPAFERRLASSELHDARVVFSLRCDGQDCELLLNDPGQRTLELEIEISRGELLQLAFGYRSVASVLSGESASARCRNSPQSTAPRLLDVLLPQGHPFMWEPDRF